jgi:hypothetical protein
LQGIAGQEHVNHFAWFQDDGFIKTGCLNTKCPGFQPEKGAPIAPGDAIGDKQNLNLKIIKVHNIPYEFVFHPVRLAYQPPANSTFLSEQTSHQQPASSTFLSEQTSTSHQPPVKRTVCSSFANAHTNSSIVCVHCM